MGTYLFDLGRLALGLDVRGAAAPRPSAAGGRVGRRPLRSSAVAAARRVHDNHLGLLGGIYI